MLDYVRTTLPYHLALVGAASSAGLTLFVLFIAIVTTLKARREHRQLAPQHLPWSGKTAGQFMSAIRANYRGLFSSIRYYREGYDKFSKKNEIFVAPTWTKGPQIVIPPSMTNWLGSRPDSILNAKDCTFDNAQFPFTVGHPEITSNDMIDILIKRELTRTIGQLNGDIFEEVDASLEGIFGEDGEWRTVGIFDSMTRTVGRASNRVFVGKELCSNMEYVMAGVSFARDISVSSYVLHAFPKFLQPLVSSIVTIPNKRHAGICMKYLQPLIQQRIDDMTRKKAEPAWGWEEPNDFLTWMVRESFKRDTEDERSAYALAYRIVLLNFAAITTSTILSTNTILDVFSQPDAPAIIAELREEATAVYHEHNKEWSKAALSKLYKLDSAIRESGRVSGVGGTALARRVKADNGISLPDGTWLPKNATVGVSMDGVHFDESYYTDPNKFDAFRFSRAREQRMAMGEKAVNEDLVTTSPHWLPFSHGIHACPGRFFAANNIKMILAHMIMNYDVEPFDHRTPNISIGDLSVVPVKATMRVRRREIKS